MGKKDHGGQKNPTGGQATGSQKEPTSSHGSHTESELSWEQLDPETKKKVLHLLEAGYGIRKIYSTLREEGIPVTRAAIERARKDLMRAKEARERGVGVGDDTFDGLLKENELINILSDNHHHQSHPTVLTGKITQDQTSQAHQSVTDRHTIPSGNGIDKPSIPSDSPKSEGAMVSGNQSGTPTENPSSTPSTESTGGRVSPTDGASGSSASPPAGDLEISLVGSEAEGGGRVLTVDVGGKSVSVQYRVERVGGREELPVKTYTVKATDLAKKVMLNPKVLLYYDYARAVGFEGDLSDFICNCIEFLFEKVLGIRVVVERKVVG